MQHQAGQAAQAGQAGQQARGWVLLAPPGQLQAAQAAQLQQRVDAAGGGLLGVEAQRGELRAQASQHRGRVARQLAAVQLQRLQLGEAAQRLQRRPRRLAAGLQADAAQHGGLQGVQQVGGGPAPRGGGAYSIHQVHPPHADAGCHGAAAAQQRRLASRPSVGVGGGRFEAQQAVQVAGNLNATQRQLQLNL